MISPPPWSRSSSHLHPTGSDGTLEIVLGAPSYSSSCSQALRTPPPPEYDLISHFSVTSSVSTGSPISPPTKKISFPNLRSLSTSRSAPNLRTTLTTSSTTTSFAPANIYALPGTLIPRTPTERARRGFSSLFSSKGRKRTLPPTPLIILPSADRYPEAYTPTRPRRPSATAQISGGLSLLPGPSTTPASPPSHWTARSAPPYEPARSRPLRVHFDSAQPGTTFTPANRYPTRRSSLPRSGHAPSPSLTSQQSSTYHPPRPSQDIRRQSFDGLDFSNFPFDRWSESAEAHEVDAQNDVLEGQADALELDQTPKPGGLHQSLALPEQGIGEDVEPSPIRTSPRAEDILTDSRRDAIYFPSPSSLDSSESSPQGDNILRPSCNLGIADIPRSTSFTSSRFSSSTDGTSVSYPYSRASESTSPGHPFHFQNAAFPSVPPSPARSRTSQSPRQSRLDPADPHALLASPSRRYASQPRLPGLQPLRLLRPLSLPTPYAFPSPSSTSNGARFLASLSPLASVLPVSPNGVRRRRSSASQVEGLQELVRDLSVTRPLVLKRSVGVQVDFPLRRLGTTLSLTPSSNSGTQIDNVPTSTRRPPPAPLTLLPFSATFDSYPSPPPSTTTTVEQLFESAPSSPATMEFEVDEDLAGARVVSASLALSPVKGSARASLLPLSPIRRDSLKGDERWSSWMTLLGQDPRRLRDSTVTSGDQERCAALEDEIERLKTIISVLTGLRGDA